MFTSDGSVVTQVASGQEIMKTKPHPTGRNGTFPSETQVLGKAALTVSNTEDNSEASFLGSHRVPTGQACQSGFCLPCPCPSLISPKDEKVGWPKSKCVSPPACFPLPAYSAFVSLHLSSLGGRQSSRQHIQLMLSRRLESDKDSWSLQPHLTLCAETPISNEQCPQTQRVSGVCTHAHTTQWPLPCPTLPHRDVAAVGSYQHHLWVTLLQVEEFILAGPRGLVLRPALSVPAGPTGARYWPSQSLKASLPALNSSV